MKKTTGLKIALWTILAVLLIALLGGLLARRGADGLFSKRGEAPMRHEGGAAGLDEVSEIRIEWTSGRVNVVPTDGKLSFYEDYSGKDKYRMHYEVNDGALRIAAFDTLATVFASNLPEKTLTVELPQEMFEKIRIESASADVDVNGAMAEKLDIETVSGKISITSCDVTALDTETVSGDIEGIYLTADSVEASSVSGAIDMGFTSCRSVDAETTSGKIRLMVIEQLREVNLDTISGQMELTLPYGTAAQVQWDSLSGRLTDHTQGLQGAEVRAQSVSGGLTIENVARERS